MTEEQFEAFKKDINENGIDNIQCIAVIKYGTTNLDIIKELFNNGETNIEDVLTINPEWALSFFQWIEPTPLFDPREERRKIYYGR